MPIGALRIGITIGVAEGESMWSNGIKQNALYLADALRRVEGVASVLMLNTTGAPVASCPWDLSRWPTAFFHDAKDSLDIVIELGSAVGPAETDYLKSRGTRLVSYCCGTEYVMLMESLIFGRNLWGNDMRINQRYDGVWVIPQVAETSLHFFGTLRRREPQVVPFVWDPVFLRERSARYEHGGEYRPRSGPRRLTVMEPNHNVVKFCLYPILIAEEAYRARPEAIAYLNVTNAERFAKDSPEFVSLMHHLDLVKNNKASFAGRYETPEMLAMVTDVVVSHQWGNPLNYFYLEVCWQGYPLVHNASLCPDLGYYYPGNDVPEGCRQLVRAIDSHDAQWLEYRERQRSAIARFLPGDAAMTRRYGELLDALMRSPIH